MRELLGGCLQAVGILIAGVTGLCMLILIAGINSWRSFIDTIGAVMLYAGITFLIGIGLIMAGRSMVRRARDDWDRWS
jgi:ABC-type proline/glycine betaine transport system permease subunit